MRRTWIALLACALLTLPAFAGDEDPAELAKGVKHYPTKFKLIKMGSRAVGPLMGQLENKDRWLVFESKSALRWIVHHARRDNKDVKWLAYDLAEYVSADVIHTEEQRAFAAELLGDLGASNGVEALMHAANAGTGATRAAAIDALRRIPGADATTALMTLAERTTGEHRDALLEVLGRRGDPAALELLIPMAEAGNGAAIRALGEGGFAQAATVLAQLGKNGTPGAMSALLRVAGKHVDDHLFAVTYVLSSDDVQRLQVIRVMAQAQRLGPESMKVLLAAAKVEALRTEAQRALLICCRDLEREAAAILYMSVLREAGDDSVMLRALAGLGRTGDQAAVALILPFLASEKAAMGTTAITALGRLPGKPAMDALIDALGKSEDAAEQSLLIRTLKERGDAQAMDALTAFMLAHQNEIKKEAGAALIALADKGGVDEARRVHHQLLEAGVQMPALRGLARTGDASSIEKITPFLGAKSAEMTGRAVAALVAIGDRLAAEDETSAIRAYRAALEGGAMVENKLRILGESIEITARGGRVSAWWVAGPFAAPDQASWSNEEFPEKRVDLRAVTKVGEREFGWKPVQVGGDDAIVDLDSLMSPNDNVAAYAFAEIHLKKARRVVFKTGSDDGIRVWINGKLVHSVLEPRGLTVDEDSFEADLAEGRNAVLVKICEGGGGWGFCLRIEDEKQRPLKFKIR